jgi:hypothetical protein
MWLYNDGNYTLLRKYAQRGRFIYMKIIVERVKNLQTVLGKIERRISCFINNFLYCVWFRFGRIIKIYPTRRGIKFWAVLYDVFFPSVRHFAYKRSQYAYVIGVGLDWLRTKFKVKASHFQNYTSRF